MIISSAGINRYRNYCKEMTASHSMALKRSHTWDPGILMFTFHLGGGGSHLFCKCLTLGDSLEPGASGIYISDPNRSNSSKILGKDRKTIPSHFSNP